MWKRIENIIREIHNKYGCQELLMPTIQSSSIWKKSGRYNDYGPEMLKFFDRNKKELLYGPTNEELITELMDWQRALSAGIMSQKAREMISKEYSDTNTKRNESLLNKISDELKTGSNGILFMREDHGLQFDNETEVFYVSSNTISKVHEWLKVEIEKLMNPTNDEK